MRDEKDTAAARTIRDEKKRRREERLRTRIRSQDGVISLAQALATDLSHAAVRRKVASKEWERLAPRTYLDTTHVLTPRAKVRAAMLSAGEDAVLVGQSAQWWWGLLDRAPDLIEIAVDPVRTPRPREGVRFHRVRVPPADRTTRHGVRIARPVHAVLDACAGVALLEGARMMDRALLEKKVSLPALQRGLRERLGRRGTPALVVLMRLAAGGARSEAERLSYAVLTAAGVTGWAANALVLGLDGSRYVGDLVFHQERVIVEVDGWAYHRDRRAFVLDGPRQTALVAAGWVVLRTHWYELTGEPDTFVTHLRAVLAARS